MTVKVRRRKRTPTVVCHKMVRAIAIEMAGALYDDVMKDNKIYEGWKRVCPDLTPTVTEALFIEMLWPKLVPQARATMAQMLGTALSEDLKRPIYEAILQDNALRLAAAAPANSHRH